MNRLFILSALVFLNNFSFAATASLGGKAESLAQLQQIPGIDVPKWFCIETDHFAEFIQKNQIDQQIEELQHITDEKLLIKKAKEIREHILSSSFPDRFYAFFRPKLAQLMHNCSAVAVRSSSIFEDLPDHSFAGIYDTFLGQKDLPSIEESVKKCWASVFNDRAVAERAAHGIDHRKALIAVIIQEMVEALVAGTAFTMEIGTGYEGIEIAANYGLGESVVGGEITVDKWLVHPKSNHIIQSTLGNKQIKIITDPTKSDVQIEAASKEEKSNYCLNLKTVQKIASQLKKIQSHYPHPHLDTEFAIDRKGKLYFLQARPLVPVAASDLQVVDKAAAQDAPILAKGLYSVPGAATGKLKVIRSFEQLATGEITIGPEDIVVTYVSTNKWSQYMTKFKGIITQEGGPTAHPILLCRERKVPCVIGLSPETFATLLTMDGQEVTLDGMKQVIYQGKLPLKRATANDFALRFQPIKQPPLPSYEEQAKSFKHYGILISEKQGDQELLWQKKPTHPLDPLMQEMTLLGQKKRAELLGLPTLPSQAKILEGYVVEPYMPDGEKLLFFSHMDLEKSEAFVLGQEQLLKEYDALTQNFSLTPENWQKYTEQVILLRAYFWLGPIFRLHANQHISLQSQQWQIPRLYIESYAEQLQSQVVEEDTKMVQDIQAMARRMKPFSAAGLEQLKEQFPEVFQELETLGRHYRFQHELALSDDLDLEAVLRRLHLEMKHLDVPSAPVEKIERDFFPQDEALRRWIEVSTKSRILQSDAHHKMIRGQWNVRDALLQLGKGEEIFNCSIEEVSRLIQEKKPEDSRLFAISD
jgi:phosphohistidine swiveling domain-containing protein